MFINLYKKETGLALSLPVINPETGLALSHNLPETGLALSLPVVRLRAASAAEPCASSASADAPFLVPTNPTNAKRSSLSTGPLALPETGLEPERPCGHKILSLARLPFRHSGVE